MEGVDVDLWEVRAGYRLLDKPEANADLYLSRFGFYGGFLEVEALSFGVAFNWYPTARSTITAPVGYSLNANFYDVDLAVFIYKLKYIYNATDRVGLMAGYRGYAMEFDDDSLPDIDLKGFFVGINLRF